MTLTRGGQPQAMICPGTATRSISPQTCDTPGPAPGGDPACDTPPGQAPGGGRPNLITNVATTDATVPDSVMTTPVHQALAVRGLLPAEHYLDSGYPSAALVIDSLRDYGITLVTPLL